MVSIVESEKLSLGKERKVSSGRAVTDTGVKNDAVTGRDAAGGSYSNLDDLVLDIALPRCAHCP